MKFVNMTASAFRDMVKKENKYHAKKTVVGDIKFDSKKESKDWLQYSHTISSWLNKRVWKNPRYDNRV